MNLLALLAAALLATPIPAAFIGHRRAHRRQNEANEIERIEAGLTVELPLIRPPWPQRQAASDIAGAYAPIDSPQAHWPWRKELEPELRYLAARPPVQPQHRAIEPTPNYVPRHALPEHEVQVVAVRSLELDRARVEEMAA